MYSLRIALLGDAAVGKTSIRKSYMGEGFTSEYQATVGADFAVKKLVLENGKDIKFQIWDLPGQIAYKNVRSVFYRGSMGALIIYDCTRRSTYENITHWVKELWKYSGIGKIPIILLGNKLDLINEFANSVDEKEGKELAKKLTEETEEISSKVEFYQTSAKTGLNIDNGFYKLGESIIKFLIEKKEKGDAGKAKGGFKI